MSLPHQLPAAALPRGSGLAEPGQGAAHAGGVLGTGRFASYDVISRLQGCLLVFLRKAAPRYFKMFLQFRRGSDLLQVTQPEIQLKLLDFCTWGLQQDHTLNMLP